jgi:hypothetical protein
MFTYLGCKIAYEEEKDVTSEISVQSLYKFWEFRIMFENKFSPEAS